MSSVETPHSVLAFWRDAGPDKWFEKSQEFDDSIKSRFMATYEAAARRELDSWEDSADGALALTIVLDQFPRNMFRGSAQAFATDPLAQKVAARALERGYDKQLPVELRSFLYLPYMHSEKMSDQYRCIELYEELGNPENLKYAHIHADIIRRFGRFPHRNAVLGRKTTADEQSFLDSGGFSG